MTIRITPFHPSQWKLYRELRLAALKDSPEAYASSYAQEIQLDDTVWKNKLELAANLSNRVALLANLQSNPSGLVWGIIDQELSDSVNVYQLWVDPKFRRQGIARALIDNLCAWARKYGTSYLALEVAMENQTAVSFYENYGFTIVTITDPELYAMRYKIAEDT